MRNPKLSDHEQKSIDKPDYQFILNHNLSSVPNKEGTDLSEFAF